MEHAEATVLAELCEAFLVLLDVIDDRVCRIERLRGSSRERRARGLLVSRDSVPP